VLLGYLRVTDSIWLWATPVISGAFLAITGGLLLWDLEHPERFYLIFTRPQWRSWLVKGAFIIAGYTVVLALHFVASWVGWRTFQTRLMIAGIPLAILTAVYTAYLFAQAKARDMWQNPLLPPHLFFQAVLLGSAILLPLTVLLRNITAVERFMGFMQPEARFLMWLLAVSSFIHLFMVWGEVSLTHPTAHSRLAIWEMVKGRYKFEFSLGMAVSVLGGLLPLLAALEILSASIGIAGAPLALTGLMLFENAYVQAAQSVPLA
jgi:formate-dependent nitrite reductase membrane component NrfD